MAEIRIEAETLRVRAAIAATPTGRSIIEALPLVGEVSR